MSQSSTFVLHWGVPLTLKSQHKPKEKEACKWTNFMNATLKVKLGFYLTPA